MFNDEFLTILKWTCGLFALWGFLFGDHQEGARKKLHACDFIPSPHEANLFAVELNKFLFNIAKESSIEGCNLNIITGCKSKNFPSFGHRISSFVQLCHALGCEVVIRRVNDDASDIEEGAPVELRNKMRKEWAEARKHAIGRNVNHEHFEPGGILDTLCKAGKLY